MGSRREASNGRPARGVRPDQIPRNPMTTSDTANTPPELPPSEPPSAAATAPGDTGARGMLAGLDPHLKRLAMVVVLGSIMSILDTTIVNVAIPTLSKDFRAPLSTVQWVSTGYLLALAMTIPLTGWAVERFGAKRMWIISLVLFLAGSALSGCGVVDPEPHRVPDPPGGRRRDDHAHRPVDRGDGGRTPADGPGDEPARRAHAARPGTRSGHRRTHRRQRVVALDLLRQPPDRCRGHRPGGQDPARPPEDRPQLQARRARTVPAVARTGPVRLRAVPGRAGLPGERRGCRS